jgi:hypothetical protein
VSAANWIFLAFIAIAFLARNIGKISPPARTAAPGAPAPVPPPGYAAAPMPAPPPPPAAPAMQAAPPPPPRPVPPRPSPMPNVSLTVPAPPSALTTRAFLRDAFANPAHARHAVILSELLGPPLALR